MKWKKTDILALMVGHGKSLNGLWDSGCAYGKYTEAALMLKITKVTVIYLRRSGVKVLTDADTNNNRNMISCVQLANKKKARLYMSVHCDNRENATTKGPKGVAPLYKSSTGKDMATTIGKSVAKQMDMTWRGAFKRTDLYELNATNMPAVIFETGFIKADLKKLSDYKAYGKALAKAICSYIGVKFVGMTNAQKFDKKYRQILEYAKDHHFKYVKEYDRCAKTWDGAKKLRQMNCQMALCYALQELNILPKGQSFYCTDNDKIKYQGGLTKAKLKKVATISHPHKPPKKLKMKKGDICGYGKPYGNPHTMEYSTKTKKGTAKWCSWSKSDIGKDIPHVKKTYSDKKISTRIRLK